jgi:hypothetical protein
MKDLALAFRRARLPVKRSPRGERRSSRKLKDLAEETGTGDTEVEAPAPPPEPIFGGPLDSWEPRYRPEAEQVAKTTKTKPKEKVPETQAEPNEDYVAETRTAVRMKETKTRRQSLSVAVSAEEARLLRKAAADRNESFSSWARNTLFRSMGRKPPARPKKL